MPGRELLYDQNQYETLQFAGTLRVLDKAGTRAVFSRRQRIRFLDSRVGVFRDFVWGEGVLFASYQANSMRIVDALPTRKGYVVSLALPKAFTKGQTFEVVTRRLIVGAFAEEAGYWDSAMQTPTRLLSIDVVAAHGRTVARPEIDAPSVSGMDADATPNRLRLRVMHPDTYFPYKLLWTWK